jgi:hypothetical protein
MKFILTLMLAALLAGCGGGGCEAGTPPFKSVPDECPDRAEEQEPPASAPGR